MKSIGGLKDGELVDAGDSDIHLLIKKVCEERLGDITEESIRAESSNSLEEFKEIWKKLHRGKFNPDAIVDVVCFEVYTPEVRYEPTGYDTITEELEEAISKLEYVQELLEDPDLKNPDPDLIKTVKDLIDKVENAMYECNDHAYRILYGKP
jgi:hypothetical protein